MGLEWVPNLPEKSCAVLLLSALCAITSENTFYPKVNYRLGSVIYRFVRVCLTVTRVDKIVTTDSAGASIVVTTIINCTGLVPGL